MHSQRVSGAYGIDEGLGWGPVVHGTVLPRAAWIPDAPAYSKSVPLIVGNTLNEFFNSVQMDNTSLDPMSMDQAWKRLSGGGASFFLANLGNGADHVIEVFRKAYPHATPFTMFSIISAMAAMRLDALTQARRKAKHPGAPAYNYRFRRQTTILAAIGAVYGKSFSALSKPACDNPRYTQTRFI